MPCLVDGNNLLYALAQAGADAGRGRLVILLEAMAAAQDQLVTVVFDGAESPGSPQDEHCHVRVKVLYAHPRTADELIEDQIAADSAPRRLIVVSSDRRLRAAARRRRCRCLPSQDFARLLLRPPVRHPGPAEPPEKRTGLAGDQTDQWLAEFGLDPDGAEKRR
jgi:hypothetical protein